jgi:ABC-2 type transport system permease protein
MKLSFRTAVKNGLETILARIETREMLESVFMELNGVSLPASVIDVLETPPNYFSESIQDNDGKTKIPSSTQHNVPAWSLFAMFFIVIALGGNIVYEKDQGSFLRLRTLPVSFMNILLAKVLTYMLVCVIQLIFVVAIGIWIFPYLGLPTFELPEKMGLFILFTLLIALAATSYGMLVGTLAKTHQQAGSFGAISVMILAAIGGVWVPTFAMPEILQQISVISPLNWGLESYYGLFIRQSSFSDLYIYALLFVLFAAGCFTVTFYSLRKQGII